MTNKAQNDAIEREALRIEEDCRYSGKGHLNSSDIWKIIHYCLGVPTAGLAALAALSNLPEWATTTCGVLAALLAGVITFFNPGNEQGRHRKSGNQFLALGKKVRRFREIDLPSFQEEDARTRLEELSEERDSLNDTAPSILWCAYQKAKSGIEAGEADYAVDGDDK